MRKTIGIVFLSIAVGGLWGCSDKLADDRGQKPDGSTNGFIVFNINTAGNDTRATRAEGTPDDSEFDSDFNIEDEYKITSTAGANAAFFFDTNGKFLSKSDLQIIEDYEDVGEHGGTYKEKLLKARIINEMDDAIASCVLILNANPNVLGELKSFTNLEEFKKLSLGLDQETTGNVLGQYKVSDGKTYLTMSNTVYIADGEVKGPVEVAGKIYPTMEEAEADPLKVHVERVAAKFSVTFDQEILGVNNIVVIDDTENREGYTKKDDQRLSVKSSEGTALKKWGILLNGWDVNGTETETYWIKNLDNVANYGKWSANTTNDADEYGWNDPNRLRSYWAVDPHYMIANGTLSQYPQQYRSANNVDYADGNNDLALYYIPYNEIGKKIASSGSETSADYYTYAPENTFEYSGDWFTPSADAKYNYAGNDFKRTSTHILVAAQLLIGDEVESHATIADKYCYENTYWIAAEGGQAPEDLINYMVDAVLLYSSSTLYKEDGGELDAQKDAAKYFELTKPANIKGGDGRVKLSLKNDVGSLYLINREKVTDETLESAIQAIGTAKHFSEGKMYYYIPIKHMAAISSDGDYKVGSYGVVRNHWYKVNVTSIAKPGIPVDDPDLPIIPNDEPDEPGYASFEIVIIPWHVINHEVEIE